MEETLNSVNAEQGSVVESQTQDATSAAEVQDTAAGESENAAPAKQQTEVKETKAAQTPDENAKYAAARRKAEADAAASIQKAKDEFAASIAKRTGLATPDRPISSADDFERYLNNLELKAAGVDPETYKQLREKDPDVIKAKQVLETQSKAQKEFESFTSFVKAFEEKNKRPFGVEDKAFYAEIKEEAQKTGKDVLDVFYRKRSDSLESRLAELEAKIKESETNKANADSSPGSVTTGGKDTATDYISFDVFTKNKGNAKWVRDNYDKIMKSRPKWGG